MTLDSTDAVPDLRDSPLFTTTAYLWEIDLPDELCPVADALNRVAAEPVYAQRPWLAWPRAHVHGYAVRSADVAAASVEQPVRIEDLTIFGPLPGVEQGALGACQFMWVRAGQALPGGADAVIELRDWWRSEHRNLPFPQSEYLGRLVIQETAHVIKPVPPGHNVLVGDIVEGQLLLAAGVRISPLAQAALQAAGVTQVRAITPPKVAILLAESHYGHSQGAMPDCLSVMVRSLLDRWGYRHADLFTVDASSSAREQRIHRRVMELQESYQVILILGQFYECSRAYGVADNRVSAGSFVGCLPLPVHALHAWTREDASGTRRGAATDAPSLPRWPLYVDLRGMPLSVVSLMYLWVRPVLEAVVYTGPSQPDKRVANDDPEQLRQAEELRDIRMSAFRRGVRWLNGVLATDAVRAPDRHWLQLATVDHSEPGKIRICVLPEPQQQAHAIAGLLRAEAMVAISSGEGVLPAGTPVQFFLLD